MTFAVQILHRLLQRCVRYRGVIPNMGSYAWPPEDEMKAFALMGVLFIRPPHIPQILQLLTRGHRAELLALLWTLQQSHFSSPVSPTLYSPPGRM